MKRLYTDIAKRKKEQRKKWQAKYLITVWCAARCKLIATSSPNIKTRALHSPQQAQLQPQQSISRVSLIKLKPSMIKRRAEEKALQEKKQSSNVQQSSKTLPVAVTATTLQDTQCKWRLIAQKQSSNSFRSIKTEFYPGSLLTTERLRVVPATIIITTKRLIRIAVKRTLTLGQFLKDIVVNLMFQKAAHRMEEYTRRSKNI